MAQPESTRPEFLKLLQSVPILDSLRETPYGTMPDITIYCWDEETDNFKTVTWNIAYPFYTLDDLKLDIYLQCGAKPEWLPSQVFVGTLTTAADAPEDADDEFAPVIGIWKELDTIAGKKGDTLVLKNPLSVCLANGSVDERFVDRSGNERPLDLLQRGRTTLETAFLDPGSGEMPEFYAFCATDMMKRLGLPLGRPVPAYEWNGRFRPYFPGLRADAYQPTDETNTKTRIAYKRQVRQLLGGIEEQLASTEPTVASKMQLSAVYALRLLLGTGSAEFTGCEDVFFRVPVIADRPFMRILPADGGPITKIHVKGIIPVPDILDPNLLPQWAQELNPNPGRDYLFAKLLTKGLSAGTLPIYATLRIFGDGSSDIVVLPSKQQRFLNPASDLRDLDIGIAAGLKGLYLEGGEPRIAEATVEIGLQLSRQDKPITRQRLLERLGLFSYFFQEAPAFESPAPILLLKYKAIDQFATEDRIFSYIAQYQSRSIISGGKMPLSLLESVMQEFAMDRELAARALDRWTEEKSKFVPIAPEINTFSEENIGGIDVGIYGQHPFYFIRIYRCNSEMTLRRIYTLLSLMLTLDIDFGNVESPEANSAEVATQEEEAVVAAVAATPIDTKPATATTAPPTLREVESDEEEEEALIPRGRTTAAKSLLVNDNSDDEVEAPVPVAAATVRQTVAKSFLVNNNSDEEEVVAPKPKPVATAARSLMVNYNDEEEEEEAPKPAPAPALPTIAAAATSKTAMLMEEESKPLTVKRAAATVKRAVATAQPEVEASGADWPSPLRGWFIKQLNRIDPKLFVFKPKHGDQDGYSRKCQASSGQQPMVLTQVEYDRMREEYQKDEDEGRVVFIEFPLKGGEPNPPASKTVERITVLKYGTDPANQNYYFCPKLFCMLDRIILLQEDFEGDQWRNPDKKGKKTPDTCPFCGGKKIDDQIKYVAGYTVAERKDKPKTNQKQTYIDFATPTTHPDNYQLPCCYIPPRENKPGDFLEKSKKMHIGNEIFSHLRGVQEEGKDEEEEEEDYMSAAAGEVSESYSIALSAFPRRYILNPTFHPLERTKFGLCPPNLDAYFNQKSDTLVSRTAIKQLMRPGMKGFFRMGVEGASRGQPDNFFGALAPYMGKNSVEEVRLAFIEKLRDPNIFLNVNFGNLVHEFYRPAEPQYRPQNVNELEQDFIKLVKVANYNPATSKPEMMRLFMAHNLFMEYLTSRTTVKEYRIFAPILAYPGLITSRGLILILLEYDSADFSKPVSVKCPPLGYQPNLYDGADFAFMLVDTQGIYEAIVYIEHFTTPGSERGRHNSYTSFQVAQLPSVAPVISERRAEFIGRCRAPNFNLYTGQSAINSRSMLTFSQLSALSADEPALYPFSIVRDSYNHIVGATFRYEYRGAAVLVPVPLADHDGYMPLGHFVHFDWTSIDEGLLPTVPALVQFYERYLGPIIAGSCPGYRPVKALRYSKKIRAVQLENGLIVPAKGTDSSLPIEDVQFVPEWQINREIAFSEGTAASDPDAIEIIKSKSLEELYQHFRLSVAGWFNSELPTEFLKNIENNILFARGLPLFEKRKRLQIELEDTLRTWFAEDDDFALEQDIFYRRDCRKITDAGSCNGACSWIGANTAAQSEGRCAIHIPTTANLTKDVVVNTSDLFIRRIIDELIVFPDKRKQLLQNSVKKTGNITVAIQLGNQYIIPDSSPRWQELLSLIWTIEKTNIYKSLEDMKGDPTDQEVAEEEPCVPLPRSVPYTVQKIRRRVAASEVPAAAQQPVPIPPLTETVPITIRRRPVAAAAETPMVIRRLPASAASAAPSAPLLIRRATAAPSTPLMVRRLPTITSVPEEAPSPLTSSAAPGNVISITPAPPTIRRAPAVPKTVAFAVPTTSIPEEVVRAPPTIRRAAAATSKPA